MPNAKLPVISAAFTPYESYAVRTGSGYELLPLRFLRLDAHRVIATNFSGQFMVMPHTVLHDLIRHRLSYESPYYDDLKSRHFLLDQDSNVAIDLLANQFRTKHSHLPLLTGLFIFVVTLRCEHSCPYCQVSRQTQNRAAFDMQIDSAERAIAILFESPSPTIKVEFQGGEPLLNFELIQWIVKRVKEVNATYQKDVSFVIATNLALIDDAMLAFCKEHTVEISTSLDGPHSLHNANRPRPGGDSYERAIAGINKARDYLGFEHVSALMTTTERSLNQVEAIVDEYQAQGFTSIFLRSLSPFGFAVKTGAVDRYTSMEWLQFYKRGLTYILQLNMQGTPMREEYAALLLRKMLTPYPTGYVDLQSPAGIGLGCLVFNYDGAVYASDEARMLAETNDTSFRLGHVADDSFQSLLTSDNFVNWITASMTESAPMCSDCGIQPFCGSDPVFHHATQGDVVGHKARSGFCTKNMEIVKHLITLLEDTVAEAKVLRSWIT